MPSLKNALTRICWPILQVFETGEAPYNYKPLHRKILVVMGSMFCLLAGVSGYLFMRTISFGNLLPIVVFFTVGFVCIVVGTLGSERAVAKIWGNK